MNYMKLLEHVLLIEEIIILFIEEIIMLFIEEIKDARYHSVLAGELTSSNDEILSICMRYVNKEKKFVKCFWIFCLWRELLVNA